MRAIIYEQPGSMQVGEAPDPTPGPGEVVISVGAVGICGSDLNIAAGLFSPTPFPIIPGHEFAGDVVAVTSDIDFIHEGDRVAVDPSLFAGTASGAGSVEATCVTAGARSVTTPTVAPLSTSPYRPSTATTSPTRCPSPRPQLSNRCPAPCMPSPWRRPGSASPYSSSAAEPWGC